MILTCPACGTSYTVKDGAIPPQGRNVRCAACKHSWHQDGEGTSPEEGAGQSTAVATDPTSPAVPAETSATTVVPEPAPVVEEADSPDGTTPEPLSQGRSEIPDGADSAPVDTIEAPDVAPEMPSAHVAIESPVAASGEEFPAWNDAGYGAEEEHKPRRKGLIIILVLVLLVAVTAAAAWFLAPREWMARVGLVGASADSPLKLMVTSQDRQKLASGNDLVSLSGRVINPTDVTQSVPALQADLRDGGGKLVYSWTIAPPAARLAPRASASFNAAELGVPADATSLTLRWAS